VNARRGIPFVVSGPSGVGKSTIVRRVLQADPNVHFSVSHTTRRPREGEVDGVDYSFVDEAEFRRLIEQNAFLEYAVYQNHFYGTSRTAVEGPTARGFDLILEVEMQGAEQLQVRLPHAVRVFIEPPSMQVLEARLRDRASSTTAAATSSFARTARPPCTARCARWCGSRSCAAVCSAGGGRRSTARSSPGIVRASRRRRGSRPPRPTPMQDHGRRGMTLARLAG